MPLNFRISIAYLLARLGFGGDRLCSQVGVLQHDDSKLKGTHVVPFSKL